MTILFLLCQYGVWSVDWCGKKSYLKRFNIRQQHNKTWKKMKGYEYFRKALYERDVLERQSLSEVKMGRGSPICESVRKKIVEYFKNNVPQHQIAKALQISSSTVHNIIKRFRETGEISVRKGQGQIPFLGLRALRRHCITHRHDSVIDITKWAQEYFQKPLSVNTIHCAICRCQLKLYRAKRKPYVNMVQKRRRVLWAKAQLKLTVSKWKSVLWSDESKFDICVGNHGRCVLRAKEEGDLPACYLRSVQKPVSLMVWGCISAYGMGSLHVLEGTMNAERYIKVLEQHMLPSRRRLFQGRPCVFQQDNAKPHTAAITTAWLHSRRVRVLNWPACSPDLSPIENIWRIIKWKIHQRRTQTFQQLETYIRQEWDQIPTPKLQKLITSMPRRLQTVLKRRGDATPW